jgi:hypothetical protein
MLGRHNATPANAIIPMTEGNPEEWQFQTVAVKRDQEICHASPWMTQRIKP